MRGAPLAAAEAKAEAETEAAEERVAEGGRGAPADADNAGAEEGFKGEEIEEEEGVPSNPPLPVSGRCA